MTILNPPTLTVQSTPATLRALQTRRSLLLGLKAMRDELGDIFSLSFPGFKAIVLSGPEAAHFTYVLARNSLDWRTEDDPVTGLLRHGVLVENDESHDVLRRDMLPYLHRQKVDDYFEAFIRRTDQIWETWNLDQTMDMLVEMRRVALLILMETLFNVDITPDMDRLWKPFHPHDQVHISRSLASLAEYPSSRL